MLRVMDVRQNCVRFRAVNGPAAGHSDDPRDGRLHRDELKESATENSGESRAGKESFVACLRNFFYRPPKALLCANGAAAAPPPPNSPAIRSADTQPAHRTQSRSGGNHSADGGTFFFEAVDDLAAGLQSDRLHSPQNSDWKCEEATRVVLWMRAGDPALRTTTIRGVAGDKSTRGVREEIETTDEIEIALQEGFHVSRGPERRPQLSEVAARPLMVWTVWTNPLCK